MGSVAFHVQHHAFTETAMFDARAEPYAWRHGVFHRRSESAGGDDGAMHLHPRAHFFDELRRHFLDEARRDAVTVDAVQATLLGVGEIELLHGPRNADIAEPSLFFEAVDVVERALMREQAVFHAREEHDRELEALRAVQAHHLHAVFPGVRLAFAGFEHRMREERFERGKRGAVRTAALRLEAARGAHE